MTPPRAPSPEDIARALGLTSKRRHAPVTRTLLPAEGPRVHSADCTCGEDACIARRVKDLTAIDAPGVARCDDAYEQAVPLLRGDDDAAMVAERRGAR